MKSSPSNLSKLTWSSSLEELYPKNKVSKSATALIQSGYQKLSDLLWLLPLRVYIIPREKDFSHIREGEYFKGSGTIVNVISRPNFKSRGKNGAALLNISAIVKDSRSEQTITLKWFNCYQSQVKKIQSLTHITFLGNVSTFAQTYQIVNPETGAKMSQSDESSLKVQYPTTNSVSSANIAKVFKKIPGNLWDVIEENLPHKTISSNQFPSRVDVFKTLHGLNHQGDSWDKELEDQCKMRLIYEELFYDQIKVHLRRKEHKKPHIEPMTGLKEALSPLLSKLPYELTVDQAKAMDDICEDFESTHPMMRLVQGDVGCGKTTIALLSISLIAKQGAQSAFMCPTEALATQHYHTITNEYQDSNLKVRLLKGSMKAKEKKEILAELKSGECNVVIGTHALIQKSVEFKKLQFVIIDEQHKFGVNQRIQLTQKGDSPHCLIMTATPIPRSLSLTQYGDLDITSIHSMPGNRKGQKTRIITEDNYQNYLNFVKTRLSMGEQVYVVVPSITESEVIDIENLEQNLTKYRGYFPEASIDGLHGQLAAEEKDDILKKFTENKINLLVSTSVVEVGINVLNATVMAIHGPERFGLSSLHQLRGRVGRGDKPGFCFLVCDRRVGKESLERLQVIEQTSDGFQIAEEDLKIRGEGNLFGTEQSGSAHERRLANIVLHGSILNAAKKDLTNLIHDQDPETLNFIDQAAKDESIFSTI